jgi:hypothetical protein
VTNRKIKQVAPAAAEASTSHSERAREPGVKYASYSLGIHKNGTINRWFILLIDIQIAAKVIFPIKLLNKIYLLFLRHK